MSTAVEIKWQGMETVIRAMAGVARRLDPLEVIGSEIESQTRRRLQEEKRSPDGDEWDDWSEKYAGSMHGNPRGKRARRNKRGKMVGGSGHQPHPGELRQSKGHSILQLGGGLLDSITYDVGNGEVHVGSNLVYAATHQYGRGAIPPRPYLGLSDANEREIEEAVDDYIRRLLP